VACGDWNGQGLRGADVFMLRTTGIYLSIYLSVFMLRTTGSQPQTATLST